MNRLIVAYDRNRAIGKNGDIPWMGALPADMQHFRSLTEGSSVIMGRKTFESLPDTYRPLPDRQNIVISLSQRAIKGALVARSLEEAFDRADHEAFIIGGGQLYKDALPYVDRIDATEIDTVIDAPDTFFPEIKAHEWDQVHYEAHSSDARNRFNYAFATYMRNNN